MTAGLATGSSPPIPKASEHPVSRTAEALTPRGSEVAIASIPDSPASDDLEKYDVNLLASDRDGTSPKPTQENLIENLLSLEAEAGNLTTVSAKKGKVTAASAGSGNRLTSSSASPTSAPFAFSKKVLPEEDTDNSTTGKKPKTEETERGRRRSSVGISSKQSQLLKPVAETSNLMESKREIATQTFSEDFAPLFSRGSNPTAVTEKSVLDKKSDKCQRKSCGYLRQKHGIKAKLEGTSTVEERLEKREKNLDGVTGNISEVAKGHGAPELGRSQGMPCGFLSGSRKGPSKSTRSVCEYLNKASKTDNPEIKNKPPMTSQLQASGSGSSSQNPSAKRRKSVDSSVPLVHEHQRRANVFINKFELRPNTFNIPTRESDGIDFYPAALNAASHAFEKLPDLYAISSNVPYNAFQVSPKNDFYIDNNTLNGYSVNIRMPLYNQNRLCNAVNMPCNAFHPQRQNQNVIHRTGFANPPFSYSQAKENMSKNTVPEKTESPLCEYLNRKRDKPPPVPPTHCNLQPTGINTGSIANVHTSSKPHSTPQSLGENRSFVLNMESFTHEEIRQPRKKSSPDILQILATHPKSQCQYLKNYQKFLLKQAATKAIEKNKAFEQSFSSMQNPQQNIDYGFSLDSSVNQIPMQGFVPMQVMNTENVRPTFGMQGAATAEIGNPPGTFSWHGEGMGPSHRIEFGSQDFMQVSTKSANRQERNEPIQANLRRDALSAPKMDSVHPEVPLLAQNMSGTHVNDLPSRHTCEYLKTKSPEEAQEGFRRRGNAAQFSPSQSLTYSSRLESPSRSDPGFSMEDEVMLGSGTKASSDLGLDAATMVSTRRPICEFILKNQRCIEKIKETLHRERRNACTEKEKASRQTPGKGTLASPAGRSSASSDSGREDMPQHLFQILMAVIVSYFLIEKELGKVS